MVCWVAGIYPTLLRAERDLFCLLDPGYKPSQPGVTAAGPSGSWSHRTYSQGEGWMDACYSVPFSIYAVQNLFSGNDCTHL